VLDNVVGVSCLYVETSLLEVIAVVLRITVLEPYFIVSVNAWRDETRDYSVLVGNRELDELVVFGLLFEETERTNPRKACYLFVRVYPNGPSLEVSQFIYDDVTRRTYVYSGKVRVSYDQDRQRFCYAQPVCHYALLADHHRLPLYRHPQHAFLHLLSALLLLLL
jgi:hypothetical protein